jgi:membrane protease YdiL (CAAX protease family)
LLLMMLDPEEQASRLATIPPRRERVRAARELVVVFAIPITLLALMSTLAGPDSGLQQPVALVSTLAMVGTIYAFLRMRKKRCDSLGLSIGLPGWRSVSLVAAYSVVAFVLAAAAFIGAGQALNALLPAPEQVEETGLEFLQGNLPALLATLAIVYVTASFSEEFIYRGFLMHRVAEVFGGGRAAWCVSTFVSAVTFGLAHYTWGLAGVVQTAGMGLALALCYALFGRRLWVTILAHGYMDTILLVQVYAQTPAAS